MQWGHIKTLFILCFLVLDVFLFMEFVDKQDKADFDLLETQQATIEQQLETEGIEIEDLPEEKVEESYINVAQKKFTDAEHTELGALNNQVVRTIDNNFIVSRMKDPVPLPSDGGKEQVTDTMTNYIFSFEEYEFWNWDKDLNVIIYFQQKNDRPVFLNQNGMILIFLNDADEMIFYTQTMLGEAELRGSKEPLITPIKAIETVFNNHELLSGDKISNTEVGFHTRVPLDNGDQVFAPTWKITVNGERNYFVNAIEGLIFSSDETQFLYDAMTSSMEKVQTMGDKNEMKEAILGNINGKLEAIKRSEGE